MGFARESIEGWRVVLRVRVSNPPVFTDGILIDVYRAIFSINLTWVIMILHAPTGLRAIAGQ